MKALGGTDRLRIMRPGRLGMDQRRLPRGASQGPWVRSLLGAALLAMVTGCMTVGPEYQRPQIDLPDRYAGRSDQIPGRQPDTPSPGSINGASDKSARAASPSATRWWLLFGDAQLNTLMNQALARNTDLQAASARIEEADALAREAGAAMLPAVNLGASGGRLQTKNLLAPNSVLRSNNLQLNALASYEIDFWGRLRRASESARAQALASREAADVLRLTTTGLIAQAWFSLKALDAQIALSGSTLAARQAQQDLLQLRVAAGTNSALELEQARIARADASTQLRELQRQRELAQTLLGRLAAQPALQIASAVSGKTDLLATLPVPPLPPIGLPSELLIRRPDIRQAEQALIAANAQIGVARATMLPSISLTASYGAQSSALASLLNESARIWSLGFGLSLPIFDGGRLQARVDQASARQKQALAAYQGAAQTAFREVSDALISSTSASQQEVDLNAKLIASQRALTLANLRHEAGYSAYLEVLDAQRSLNAAQQDAVRNRQARLQASVELFKALSGGWEQITPSRNDRNPSHSN
jgi:multidrug efflux system outer membrane protein